MRAKVIPYFFLVFEQQQQQQAILSNFDYQFKFRNVFLIYEFIMPNNKKIF